MRLTNEQRTKISIRPVTQGGNPAPIDGDVSFASSDENVARVDVIDGRNAYVTAVGLGAAQITAVFDANLGDGVREVTASGALEVVAAEAESVELIFEAPELIPPPVE